MNSRGEHIGELPSQQPPDWWNISGPCFAGEAAEQVRRLTGQVDPGGSLTGPGRPSLVVAPRLTANQKKPSASGE